MSEPASEPGAGIAAVAARLDGLVRHDEPIGLRTTYRVGGRAALFAEIGSEDDLARVRAAVATSGVAILVVGRGSNLLVAEAGFPGLVLSLGDAFSAVEVEGTRVRAGGAASLPVVARRTAKAALTGFEWAVGVPGSVGGAARMNAGGHGSDMAASLHSIRVVDLAADEDCVVPASALDLGYRRSAIGPAELVVEATLDLAAGDRAAAEAEIGAIVRWRRANQPGGQNAGSVFTNPEGDSAGRLIDAAGVKGLRVGTAEVSPRHANFILADEGGSADDVFALMLEVADRVAASCGVHLRPETRLAGFAWPEDRR